jgi:hypothetical protein
MHLSRTATELTTAATDAVLGLLCLVVVLRLVAVRANAPWKRALWCWVFGLLALGSVLGAIAHGLELPGAALGVLWWFLYLSLGVTVALFVVGGICDWRSERAARAALPWAMGVGASFAALTQVLGGAFVIFVAYEAAAMVATLAMYAFLTIKRRLASAGMVTAGIGLSIVAAAVQASALSLRLIAPFDHNGLFHLVQLGATAALATGLCRGLDIRHWPARLPDRAV